MPVDSFKYVSRLVTRYYKMTSVTAELPIPWSPVTRPLSELRFGLVTSGGLYQQGTEAPFDLAREQRQPEWGDPTFRTLPVTMDPAEVAVSHWHVKADDILEDVNILLPIHRFQELAADGKIGGLVERAYSFMGYQGFPADLTAWKEEYGPQVAANLQADGADCVFLTTA
jgi:hypothetical protein